jgi:hypothetical protein
MPTLPLLVALSVIILTVLIYRPILKLARADMAVRKQDGLGNGIVYAVLLIPIFGPLVYLLVRKLMLPD